MLTMAKNGNRIKYPDDIDWLLIDTENGVTTPEGKGSDNILRCCFHLLTCYDNWLALDFWEGTIEQLLNITQ